MDKLCVLKDSSGQQLGSRVFGDCDILISKVMWHLMTHDALQNWEQQRDARMKEYDMKRTES